MTQNKKILDFLYFKEIIDNYKDYYDNKDFNSKDVYDISKGTNKENQLFDYDKIPNN